MCHDFLNTNYNKHFLIERERKKSDITYMNTTIKSSVYERIIRENVDNSVQT